MTLKILSFLIALFASILATSLLLQILWNDVAINMFALPHLSFIHAVELNVICRLLFQTFEFDTRIE